MFENIDDEELQKNVLVVKVIDEDVISRDDLIGRVVIDLSSLLNRDTNQNIQTWFPIYDMVMGIRGEIHVEVKLDFVRDENIAKNIQSSLVQFFSSTNPPLCIVRQMLGFVEELVDFKKSDKEADNMILIQEGCLKLRRKLGKIVIKKGGNAIISYRQVLDNEGVKSKRIVLRGYGTAVDIKQQYFNHHVDEASHTVNSS